MSQLLDHCLMVELPPDDKVDQGLTLTSQV